MSRILDAKRNEAVIIAGVMDAAWMLLGTAEGGCCHRPPPPSPGSSYKNVLMAANHLALPCVVTLKERQSKVPRLISEQEKFVF